MYHTFAFDMPTRVLFGAGSLNHLRNEKLPGKKALIATSNGQSTKKYGYLARVEKEMELAGVEHSTFPPSGSRQRAHPGATKSA